MDQSNSENQSRELVNTIEHPMATEPESLPNPPDCVTGPHPIIEDNDTTELNQQTKAVSESELGNLPEQDLEMSNTIESTNSTNDGAQAEPLSQRHTSQATAHDDDSMAVDPKSEESNEEGSPTAAKLVHQISEMERLAPEVTATSQQSSSQQIDDVASSKSVGPKEDIASGSGIAKETSELSLRHRSAFEECLIKEGAMIEDTFSFIEKKQPASKPDPSSSKQLSSTQNGLETKKPTAAAQKKMLDKELATRLSKIKTIPKLPIISRTTIHAFFTFLYFLTQRHWDSSILVRKLLFFREVEAQLRYPCPIRHYNQKLRFMSTFQELMLDVAEKDWKKNHNEKWTSPPTIDGYDPTHPLFEDITISFIGWDKREDRELQVFSDLILRKKGVDKEEDEERIADGEKERKYSLEARNLVRLTEDPPKLLERIKELRIKLDEGVRIMKEDAKAKGLSDNNNMAQDEFIEYYTYYLPAPPQPTKVVAAEKVVDNPVKVIKPPVAKTKSNTQASAHQQAQTIDLTKGKKRGRPVKETADANAAKSTKNTPPATPETNKESSPKTKDKAVVADEDSPKADLPETPPSSSPNPNLPNTSTASVPAKESTQKAEEKNEPADKKSPKPTHLEIPQTSCPEPNFPAALTTPDPAKPRITKIVFVTKPGTAQPVKKPRQKRKKPNDDDDFIDDNEYPVIPDDYDEDVPQRKRRRGRK